MEGSDFTVERLEFFAFGEMQLRKVVPVLN
jgi:hypothetical protein